MAKRCMAITKNGRGPQCGFDATLHKLSTVRNSREDAEEKTELFLCAEHAKSFNRRMHRRIKTKRVAHTTAGALVPVDLEKVYFWMGTTFPAEPNLEPEEWGTFSMTMAVFHLPEITAP